MTLRFTTASLLLPGLLAFAAPACVADMDDADGSGEATEAAESSAKKRPGGLGTPPDPDDACLSLASKVDATTTPATCVSNIARARLSQGSCGDVVVTDGRWVSSMIYPTAPVAVRNTFCRYRWQPAAGGPAIGNVHALARQLGLSASSLPSSEAAGNTTVLDWGGSSNLDQTVAEGFTTPESELRGGMKLGSFLKKKLKSLKKKKKKKSTGTAATSGQTTSTQTTVVVQRVVTQVAHLVFCDEDESEASTGELIDIPDADAGCTDNPHGATPVSCDTCGSIQNRMLYISLPDDTVGDIAVRTGNDMTYVQMDGLNGVIANMPPGISGNVGVFYVSAREGAN